jgi:parallel beta-helix repeat protein
MQDWVCNPVHNVKTQPTGVKMSLKRLLLVALVSSISHTAYAAKYCVTSSTELQTALTMASYNGEDDEIQIVQGTYTGNFIFVSSEESNLTINGGYTEDCASREVDPTNTVIDANSLNNVFILIGNNTINFVIDGLTIENGNTTGNAKNGGGLYIKTTEGEVTLTNNIVTENQATNSGGGVFIEGALTVSITDNEISDNTIPTNSNDRYGGGIYVGGSSTVTFTENVISGNTISGYGNNHFGGGIYVGGSSTVTFTDNEISGNAISGNSAYYYGGGIYVGGSSTVTFTDNEISGNTISGYGAYYYGGGIFVGGSSTATLTGNEISGNTVFSNNNSYPSYGGGIFFDTSSTATLTDNEISGNTVSSSHGNAYGGGIFFNSSSTATLTSNVISGNTASSNKNNAYGGGIFFNSSSTGTLTSNEINGNTANTHSGGIHFGESSTGTLTSNTINGNNGGGAYFYKSSEANIINNVITANIAGSNNGGGLLILESDTTTLTNNTISNNGANNGGGIYLKLQDDTDTADIYNNIVWDNTAETQGNDLYIDNDGNGNYMPSTFNLLHNDFDQSYDGTRITLPILIDSSNLDNIDPIYVDDEDYHLQASSPCIDAGDNDAPSLPTTDKDGNPRITNSIVDIGAYEQTDGQTKPGKLQFSKANYKVKEDGGTVTLIVKRVKGKDGEITIDYATSDDTATAGDDYTATSGTINWANGDNAGKTITIDIINDSEVEDDETLIVSLGNPTGGAELGEPDTAEVTITDDDETEKFNCKNVTEIPTKECQALTALYDSTDGKNWESNTGWNATNNPCDWFGVNCRSKHVTGLSLGNNNLIGTISKKFFKLKTLESLVLSDNDLNGTNIKDFKKLKKLESLLLNNSKLSGTIHKSLMKLKKLVELDINDNCFETEVPKKLKKWLDELNPGWDETQTNCLY